MGSKGGTFLKYRFLFELKLCNPRTGCDVVVNHWAVCLSLLRDVFDRLFSFFYVVSFLRQRVSMCPFGGGRIPVWMCWFRQGSELQGMHCALK